MTVVSRNPLQAVLNLGFNLENISNNEPEMLEMMRDCVDATLISPDHPVIAEIEAYLQGQQEVLTIPGAIPANGVEISFSTNPYLLMYITDANDLVYWNELFDIFRDVVIENNSQLLLSLKSSDSVAPKLEQKDVVRVLEAIAEIGVKIPAERFSLSEMTSIEDALLKLSSSEKSTFYSLLEKVLTHYVMLKSWIVQVDNMRARMAQNSNSEFKIAWDVIHNNLGRLSIQSVIGADLATAGANSRFMQAIIDLHDDDLRQAIQVASEQDVMNNSLVTDYYDLLNKTSEELAIEATVLEGQLDAVKSNSITSSYQLLPTHYLAMKGELSTLNQQVEFLGSKLKEVLAKAHSGNLTLSDSDIKELEVALP